MRKKIDNIEIKEPPIQELNKKRSCLFRTCTTGCGCIILFLIVTLLLVRFATTPRIKDLKEVPEHVVRAIPVYDIENIDSIGYTSGGERSKAIERAALIPKVILSPLLVTLERHLEPEDSTSTTYFNWTAFKEVIQEPVADHRDIYQLEWTSLPAKPRFIQNFYKSELTKRRFNITQTSDTDTIRQFSFRKKNIDGAIYIKDDPDEPGTDLIVITVNLETSE